MEICTGAIDGSHEILGLVHSVADLKRVRGAPVNTDRLVRQAVDGLRIQAKAMGGTAVIHARIEYQAGSFGLTRAFATVIAYGTAVRHEGSSNSADPDRPKP